MTRARALGTVAVVGAGAAGGALARGLAAAGVPLVIWSRDGRRAGRLVTALEGARRGRDLADLAGAETLWLCVADRALEPVAGELAEALPAPPRGSVALHASGFHGPSVLAPLASAGWPTGGAHPLVSLPRRKGSAAGTDALHGAWFALCGDEPARRRGSQLARALGGRVLALAPGGAARRRYHAAASLLAGGTAALFDAAEATLEGAVSAPRPALARLLASVVANLESSGAREALTGPAARGDVDVLEGQLDVMGEAERELYAALLGRMVRMAKERGTLDAATAARILELLAER